tara:strand:- start:9197 stop:9883 length:687 start_codon:yes stop_codon:yes gene_type:complete
MAKADLLKPLEDPINAICNFFKVTEIFQFRLEREQRLVAFRKEVERLVKETKYRRLDAVKVTQNKFGYTSAKEEREMYRKHLLDSDKTISKERTAERDKRGRVKKRDMPFEEALASLPAVSSPAATMEWIKSHPAMSRKDRSAKGNERILIGPKDILESPNGPCPSRTAAQQLQHWANRPDQFFKDVLSETKKAKQNDEEVASKERAAKSNKEIRELLDSLNRTEEDQ